MYVLLESHRRRQERISWTETGTQDICLNSEFDAQSAKPFFSEELFRSINIRTDLRRDIKAQVLAKSRGKDNITCALLIYCDTAS